MSVGAGRQASPAPKHGPVGRMQAALAAATGKGDLKEFLSRIKAWTTGNLGRQTRIVGDDDNIAPDVAAPLMVS